MADAFVKKVVVWDEKQAEMSGDSVQYQRLINFIEINWNNTKNEKYVNNIE